MELVCNTCGISKDTTEFHKNNHSKRGYQNKCKTCKATYQQEHAEEHLAASRKSYVKNIEKERARSAAKHKKDPSKALARSRKHRQNNPEHVREVANKRRQADPEKFNKQAREWKAAHPKETAASHKNWVSKNRAHVYATNNKRRTLTRHGVNGEIIDLDTLYARDGGICQLCHKKCPRKQATREHIVPLSKGGEHSWKNVVLAHGRCNSRKGNKAITQQLRLF